MKNIKGTIFIIILILLYPFAVSSAGGILILAGNKTTTHEISFKYPISLTFNNKVFQSASIDWEVAASNSITALGFLELSPRIELSLARITDITTPEFTNSLPEGAFYSYSNFFKNTILGVSLEFEKKVRTNPNLSVNCGITTTPVYPANFSEYYNNIDKSSKLTEYVYAFKYIIPSLVMYNFGIEVSSRISLAKYRIVKDQTIDLIFAIGRQLNGWFRNYYYEENFYPCIDFYYAHIGLAY